MNSAFTFLANALMTNYNHAHHKALVSQAIFAPAFRALFFHRNSLLLFSLNTKRFPPQKLLDHINCNLPEAPCSYVYWFLA